MILQVGNSASANLLEVKLAVAPGALDGVGVDFHLFPSLDVYIRLLVVRLVYNTEVFVSFFVEASVAGPPVCKYPASRLDVALDDGE